MDEALEIRKKCDHFRVLIVGAANAGKTTILQKVCMTTEDPQILSPSGELLDLSVVTPSDKRGIHDINNQLVFKSNPQFIFHDSGGFEAGSKDEVKQMRKFIHSRATTGNLEEQLHVIWYCISTDSDRPILAADETFFKEFGRGKVPIVVLFTKFDTLVAKSFNALEQECGSFDDLILRSQEGAAAELKTGYLDKLEVKGPYVVLQEMDKEHASVDDLIKSTADALNNDALKLLFVSVQRNNIAICIESSLKHIAIPQVIRREVNEVGNIDWICRGLLSWFPHSYEKTDYSVPPQDRRFVVVRQQFGRRVVVGRAAAQAYADDVFADYNENLAKIVNDLDLKFKSLAMQPFPQGLVYLCTAMLLCAEYSSHLSISDTFPHRFKEAEECYFALEYQEHVQEAVEQRIIPLLTSIPTDRQATETLSTLILEAWCQVIQDNHLLLPAEPEHPQAIVDDASSIEVPQAIADYTSGTNTYAPIGEGEARSIVAPKNRRFAGLRKFGREIVDALKRKG